MDENGRGAAESEQEEVRMAAWRKNERIEPTFGGQAEADESEIRVSADDRAVVASNDRRAGARGAPREIDGRATRRDTNSRDLGSGGTSTRQTMLRAPVASSRSAQSSCR